MSEYVKCPLCGIETKANEAHGCAGPRVEVIDPRDARIAALEAENAKLREAVNEALGCLDAAEAEGWSEAIANIDEDWARERIADVWLRRVSHIRGALETQNEPT